MAIQQIDLKVPGGDTPRSANTKINNNFSDQSNAASRLVGKAAGQVPLVQYIAGLTYSALGMTLGTKDLDEVPSGQVDFIAKGNLTDKAPMPPVSGLYAKVVTSAQNEGAVYARQDAYDIYNNTSYSRIKQMGNNWGAWVTHYNSGNTTKDSNGFLKGASPIVKVFADKVELNGDAENQNVTYKRNGIGDYTITTVSGLSTDGWYIELPKDMNGNPKVAIGTLDDKDGVITLKTYKRIFSMETFTFEPDMDNPLDVPDGRWIDLRLNEIPVEEVVNL